MCLSVPTPGLTNDVVVWGFCPLVFSLSFNDTVIWGFYNFFFFVLQWHSSLGVVVFATGDSSSQRLSVTGVLG